MLGLLSYFFHYKTLRACLLKGLSAFFAAIGVYRSFEWLIEKAASAQIIADITNDKWFIRAAIIVSAIYIGNRILPKRFVSSKIINTDIRVGCKICNILIQGGDVALACNDTFDTTFADDFVARDSLQGSFQLKYYGEKGIKKLDSEIEEELKNESEFSVLSDRTMSKVKRYRPGTTIKVSVGRWWNLGGRKHAYFVALAQSTPKGATTTTFDSFAEAIQRFWWNLRMCGYKTKLNIPVLGSGRSGLTVDRMTMIKELVYSFVTATKNFQGTIVPELVICVSPKDAIEHNVDLEEIGNFIHVLCRNKSLYGDRKSINVAALAS